jgi:iron complex outermembrane receptor protein
MKREFRRSPVALAVSSVFGTAMMLALGSQCAIAQQKVERVEVTGSSISRVASENALPVTILTAEDIQKTGVTSTTELIQMLPQIQGFVAASSSVNGGGGGVTTASLHALPSKYTLVLLDGERMAPALLGNSQGGGSAANLASIAIDAIERVEILTDGASALYGSDAIGGVVNFILKKNKTDGDAYAHYNSPQHPGGGGWSAGVSKGFGNFQSDGYNVLFTLSHDKQEKVDATQRSFSAPGAYFPFSYNGTNYIFNQATSNTEPANITFRAVPKGSPAGTASTAYTINPYYAKNGNCGSSFANAITDPAALGATGVSCRFNYASTVMDVPGSKRDSGLLRGAFKVGADTTVWGVLNLSDYTMTSRFAPGAQPMSLGTAASRLPALYNTYVVPFLNANNLDNAAAGASKATMGYRAVANGGRTDDFNTKMRHLSFGADGAAMGWDYKASLTLSRSTFTDTAAGGYTDFDMLSAAVGSGAYDPVMGTGTGAIAGAVLKTKFSESVSDLKTLRFRAQRDMFSLAGGPSILSLGAEMQTFHYTVAYSDLILSQSGFSTQPASSNYPVGGNYGQVPFDASRTNWGAHGEWLFPVAKQFEVTASARYDSYAKVHSKQVFDTAVDPVTGLQNKIGDADLGNTFNSTTGKLSFRFTPMQTLLLRGSYGTGFKAPSVGDIAGALAFGGSTGGSYPCPFPGSAGCIPGSAQYDFLTGPNSLAGDAGLKPEKSRQWTLGFRFEPVRNLSIGMDVWDVKLTNQIISQGIPENLAFNNPQQYKGLFINPYNDPAGFTTIAQMQIPFNGGEAEYQGIDWDVSGRTGTPIGNLVARWTGTYMLKHRYNLGPGLPFETDLGVFGPDNQVVFRTIMNLAVSLQSGALTNTLILHYKSGYKDQAYPAGTSVFLANPNGSQGATAAMCCLNVAAYQTVDYQGTYDYNKSWRVTFGIRNLFDKNPPLSLQNAGGGNQVGYDGRYTDPIGRTLYLRGMYKF